MRTLFQPSLIDELTGDPGIWVDLMDEGRSVLVDCGDLTGVATRKLLRVDHVVVTHTHMDHFVGFDHLLRLALRRDRELSVTGPPGFLRAVEGRIGAYTWNLIGDYPVRLHVQETDGERIRAAEFSAATGMRAVSLADRRTDGTVHAERLFTVDAVLLDHGIPVLGVALREVEHLGIDRSALERLGLVPGPWLRELKASVRHREPEDQDVEAEASDGSLRRFRRGDLANEIVRKGPGQRLAYVTDVARTDENDRKIVTLAEHADLLICEAAFLHADVALARSRRHLTARDAGELALAAGAQRLAPFHMSPRYQGREQELIDEAAEAFGGPVLRLPVERGMSPTPGSR